jgi:hypothetical protein
MFQRNVSSMRAAWAAALIGLIPMASAPVLADSASRGCPSIEASKYLGDQSGNQAYALTDGPAISIDWTNGYFQTVTLHGDRKFAFSGGKSGNRYLLAITQDEAGSRQVTWPASVRWPGEWAPSLTTLAAKTDYIGFIYNGASASYDILFFAQNY